MMAHPISYRRILNKMGYYAYQNGLIYSHLRQEGGWDGHLERCRKFINRALEYYRPETVTVLGSGWLLDLPLAEMLEKAVTVYLVDIIHPPEVIKQTGNISKVVLVEQDVTGGLVEEVWKMTDRFSLSNKLKSLESISVPQFAPGFDPGFVISLNILTQLESRLIERLRKRAAIPDNELLGFRKGIQEKHIEFLSRHPSVLISDYAEVITKKSGDISSIQTLLATLPQGLFNDEWTWDIDLKGDENYNSRSVMKVLSVAF
jgi:hypothetical protein